jgi:hypothetical protein
MGVKYQPQKKRITAFGPKPENVTYSPSDINTNTGSSSVKILYCAYMEELSL